MRLVTKGAGNKALDMNVAGIDTEMSAIKAVVLRDDINPTYALLPARSETGALVARKALSQASRQACITIDYIEYIKYIKESAGYKNCIKIRN
ncbi:hypothetical protein ACFLWI_06435 [Chloroflexota bacterium]